MKKNVLITGTSTGLGKSVAIQLALKGFNVIATMRNLEKKKSLLDAAAQAGVSIDIKKLDIEDTSSINNCIEEVIQKDGQIDILINNAGAGFVGTTEHTTEEEIKWVLDVNFFGVVRCTKAVLPHMRKAKAGHIINISSVGGLVGQPFNEFYCAAKFAVEGYTESLASYIQPFLNIKFTTIEPGGISSEFAASALKKLQSTNGIKGEDYLPILEKYIEGAQNRPDGVYQTPDEVAEVICQCIENPDPPIRIRTSQWADDLCKLKTQSDPSGKLLQESVVKTFL